MKILLTATVCLSVANTISGVIQLALGHWTGVVGLACGAVLMALAHRQVRAYNRLLGSTEPPKASGPTQG
jgi:membrane associated rhomboid family serine protease